MNGHIILLYRYWASLLARFSNCLEEKKHLRQPNLPYVWLILWLILNVSSLTGSAKKHKIFRMPYRWAKDFHLSVSYLYNKMSNCCWKDVVANFNTLTSLVTVSWLPWPVGGRCECKRGLHKTSESHDAPQQGHSQGAENDQLVFHL